MKKVIVLFTLAIGIFSISCNETSNNSTTGIIKSVNVAEFEKLISENNGILLDVRTPSENKAGNIKGSILIDVTNSSFAKKIESIDKTKPILVYCKSGNRSMKAAKLMETKGFTDIYNLKGGYRAWSSTH